jgi:hypothetical protein
LGSRCGTHNRHYTNIDDLLGYFRFSHFAVHPFHLQSGPVSEQAYPGAINPVNLL